MADNESQRSILAAELYWFGGVLSAPKVFDAGTSFHAEPMLRGSVVRDEDEPDLAAVEPRFFRYHSRQGQWSVTVDEV